MNNADFFEFSKYLLIVMGSCLLIALGLGFYLVKKLPKAQLQEGLGFFATLRQTPFLVVVFLDALDLGLDSFGAPIAWWVLSRLGYDKLRGVAVLETFVPGTGILPTMTVSWLLSRVLKGSKSDFVEAQLTRAKKTKTLSKGQAL